jgi:hypothetical protein
LRRWPANWPRHLRRAAGGFGSGQIGSDLLVTGGHGFHHLGHHALPMTKNTKPKKISTQKIWLA